MRLFASLLLFVACAATQPGAARAAFFNEVMANPGAFDWNQDGSPDISKDEYVEVLNRDVRDVDITGWTISDSFGVRHVFAYPTLLRPGGSIVVFGGGTPTGIPGLAVAASTGSLGLNNTGDTIELRNGATIEDSVVFGVPTAGVSINRNPDATPAASFALHDTLSGASGGGSPGLRPDQSVFQPPPLTLPFINEWLPHPASLANDWNGDGLAQDFDDEFVEIVNPPNGGAVDLDGWTLRDNVSIYHTFAPSTVLQPGASIVVIGGGPPVGIPGLVIEGTSWGSISNALDDLYLIDETGEPVSQVSHTSQTADVSWNRDPDAAANTPFFALHNALALGHLSSPGRRVDGTPFPTPEPHAAPLAALVALGALRRRRVVFVKRELRAA